MRVRMMVVAAGAVLAAACNDAKSPTAPGVGQPQAEIVHGGASGFCFLPPMVSNSDPACDFSNNSLASPQVRICLLGTSGECASPLVTFTTTTSTPPATIPGNSETVRDGGDHWIVNWHTRDFDPDVGTYRVCVSAGGVDLGYADVKVVEKGKDLQTVTGDFVALLDGRTLPIKFRIQDGAAGLDANACFTSDGEEVVEIT